MFIIQPVRFFRVDGQPLATLSDGNLETYSYLYADFLPSYDSMEFDTAEAAEAWIAKRHRGVDVDGINAEFEILEEVAPMTVPPLDGQRRKPEPMDVCVRRAFEAGPFPFVQAATIWAAAAGVAGAFWPEAFRVAAQFSARYYDRSPTGGPEDEAYAREVLEAVEEAAYALAYSRQHSFCPLAGRDRHAIVHDIATPETNLQQLNLEWITSVRTGLQWVGNDDWMIYIDGAHATRHAAARAAIAPAP